MRRSVPTLSGVAPKGRKTRKNGWLFDTHITVGLYLSENLIR